MPAHTRAQREAATNSSRKGADAGAESREAGAAGKGFARAKSGSPENRRIKTRSSRSRPVAKRLSKSPVSSASWRPFRSCGCRPARSHLRGERPPPAPSPRRSGTFIAPTILTRPVYEARPLFKAYQPGTATRGLSAHSRRTLGPKCRRSRTRVPIRGTHSARIYYRLVGQPIAGAFFARQSSTWARKSKQADQSARPGRILLYSLLLSIRSEPIGRARESGRTSGRRYA